jgi:diguanylate cyclase (GGDEF)-like protein
MNRPYLTGGPACFWHGLIDIPVLASPAQVRPTSAVNDVSGRWRLAVCMEEGWGMALLGEGIHRLGAWVGVWRRVAQSRPSALGREQGLLALGFAVLIVLMLVQTLISLRQFESQRTQLKGILEDGMAKLELVGRMHAAGRERILRLQRLFLVEDPFEREAEREEFGRQAQAFIQARQALLAMPLQPQERRLLARQGELSRRFHATHLEVLDLLEQGEVRQAERRLSESLLPTQYAVLATLNELYALQQDRARRLGAEAEALQNEAKRLILLVAGLVTLLALAVAYTVFRRIRASSLERERQATYDALTGLPNRLLIQSLIEQAIARAQRRQGRMAVMFIDLDRFKAVNDSLGHKAGDQLLIEIARRLQGCLRAGDRAARLAGDEFVVLLEDIARSEETIPVAKRILQAVQAPVLIDGQEVYVGASIGIAVCPEHGTSREALVKHADAAMYRVKERGRNGYQVFDAAQAAPDDGGLELRRALHQALARDELVVHYQPQVDVQTGSVTGVEALVRWQHPQRGLLPPAAFLAEAEACGLMWEVGCAVTQKVCRQLRAWLDAGLPPVRVALNLADVEFWHPDLVERLRVQLAQHGLPAELLEMELTEGVVVRQAERADQVLNDLRALGVRIALDDFGTGYSSLARLQRLPIDTIKIDRAFVSGLTADREGRAIVGAVIGIARSLGFALVAEGVETRAQADILQALGCPCIQGYLVSPPVPAQDLEPLLRAGWSCRDTVGLERAAA